MLVKSPLGPPSPYLKARGMRRPYPQAGYTTDTTDTNAYDTTTDQGARKMQLREEQLTAQK